MTSNLGNVQYTSYRQLHPADGSLTCDIAVEALSALERSYPKAIHVVGCTQASTEFLMELLNTEKVPRTQ